MIQIPASLIREVHQHVEESYPNECCGLLIGVTEGGNRRAHTFRRCRNLNTERAKDRYEMDPKCQLAAEAEFRTSPWEIIGIYHSHPDHPSRASQTDTDRALAAAPFSTYYSYVIISVEKGKVAGAQSWVLDEREKRFNEEPIQIEAAEPDGGKQP